MGLACDVAVTVLDATPEEVGAVDSDADVEVDGTAVKVAVVVSGFVGCAEADTLPLAVLELDAEDDVLGRGLPLPEEDSVGRAVTLAVVDADVEELVDADAELLPEDDAEALLLAEMTAVHVGARDGEALTEVLAVLEGDDELEAVNAAEEDADTEGDADAVSD